MKEYNPELYYDLELNIMSCLLQRPSLMEKSILEDKHFIKYQRLWKYMKAFYSKYKTFDIPLMVSLTTDKRNLVEYLSWIVEIEPAPSRFEIYQKQLIELYNEGQKNKWIIDKVFDLANELCVRKVSVYDFREKVEKIYQDSEKIFKKKGE